MNNFFVENAWFIAFLPLWSAVLIILLNQSNLLKAKTPTVVLTLLSSITGFVWSLFLLNICTTQGLNYEFNMPFINVGDFNINFGFMLDNLTVLMLIIVSGVSAIVQWYSVTYMKDDNCFHKFFAYLNIFNFSMLFLVLSSNLIQMYIFWELVGLSSYLLIGFWSDRPSAAKAATKAFLINRMGDFGFLGSTIALGAFSFYYWQYNNLPFLSFNDLDKAASAVLGTTTPLIFTFICLGFILATCAKSAQLPLHTWLADAMEGPTPVSALIHGATMVAAGIFLIARIYPFLLHSDFAMNVIAWIGAITALITAVIAVKQNDIKKVLAFSTSSQIGLMMMALGAGCYTAGIFHLTTHAYFKTMLFLCSGVILHIYNSGQDMRYMGGLRKENPLFAILYLIGIFSITGILFSGFWSKEMILSGILASEDLILFFIAVVVSFLTVIYMFRTYFMIFEGKCNCHKPINKMQIGLVLPIAVIAIPATFSGWFLNDRITEFIKSSAQLIHTSTLLPVVCSILAILTGFFLVFIFYKFKFGFKSNCITKTVENKFYFDEIYEFFFPKIFSKIAKYTYLFDKYVVDGIVNCCAFCVQIKSKILLYFQNGNTLSYTTCGIFWFGLLILIFVAGFSIYMLGAGL